MYWDVEQPRSMTEEDSNEVQVPRDDDADIAAAAEDGFRSYRHPRCERSYRYYSYGLLVEEVTSCRPHSLATNLALRSSPGSKSLLVGQYVGAGFRQEGPRYIIRTQEVRVLLLLPLKQEEEVVV